MVLYFIQIALNWLAIVRLGFGFDDPIGPALASQPWIRNYHVQTDYAMTYSVVEYTSLTLQ